MSRRSKVAPGIVFKNFSKVAKHPWIASKLVKLQGEKILFDLMYPFHENGRANKIRQVSIRITDLCNLRCIMCGQWGQHGFLLGKNLKELKKEEVPYTRYVELMQDLVANGHQPNVYIWGGEPTMYEGLTELLTECTKLKLPCSIVTNGTKLKQFAKSFVDIPLFLLQVSIDGHCAKVHNTIRKGVGNLDSFSAIMEGLDAVDYAKRSSGAELPLVASLTTISKDNVNHLVDIYQTFRNKVDMFVFYPSWWIDEESAKAHDKDFERRFGFKPELHWGWLGGWKLEDYYGLAQQLKELDKLSKSWNSPPVVFIPNIRGIDNLEAYYNDHSERFGYDECISIYQAVELDSNGDMSPCRDYHDYIVGNVKHQTISELWNSEAYCKFRQSLSKDGLMPVCSRCCGLMGY